MNHDLGAVEMMPKHQQRQQEVVHAETVHYLLRKATGSDQGNPREVASNPREVDYNQQGYGMGWPKCLELDHADMCPDVQHGTIGFSVCS